MTYQSVTLKVCEGCGTLWFRKQAGAGVYCAPCTDILQHFPDPKTRRRPGRPKRRTTEATTAGMETRAARYAAGPVLAGAAQ